MNPIKKKLGFLSAVGLFVLWGTGCAAPIQSESGEGIAVKQTEKIARVTGPTLDEETIPNPNNTHERFAVQATDLGIMWDATTEEAEPKVMIAFGDTYDDGWYGFGGGGEVSGWRGNVLGISTDDDLSDGLTIDSMIADEETRNYAKEIIFSEHNTSGYGDFTTIPTAGITVGDRHYLHYMQIKNWGPAGRWFTNFSKLAYSDDEGQNWEISDVEWPDTSNFAQAAFVKDDGYVYMFGTPSGRFGPAYLARVIEKEVLSQTSYEYWNGEEWIQGDETAAVPVVDAPVSELSVQYNSHYDQWIMMYLNEARYSMVIRTAPELTGEWSPEVVIAEGEEFPMLYGGYIHPWTNDGPELYYVMSEWEPYNVVLMKTELEQGEMLPNLIENPSFEKQAGSEFEEPWMLEEGSGGVDLAQGNAMAGGNNAYLRSDSGTNTLTQTVTVESNHSYELSAFLRTHYTNKSGVFGVRDENGEIIAEESFGNLQEYTKLVVPFQSGDNEEVTIFISITPEEDTWVQIDDIMLFEED